MMQRFMPPLAREDGYTVAQVIGTMYLTCVLLTILPVYWVLNGPINPWLADWYDEQG